MLSGDVKVEEGAVIRNSVIMSGVRICKGAKVEYSIIDHDTVIGEDACVGEGKREGESPLVIGAELCIEAGSVIGGGLMVDGEYLEKAKGAEIK